MELSCYGPAESRGVCTGDGGSETQMMLKTTSHRSRDNVDFVLGRHPQYYYTFQDGGCFLKLDDPVEIEKVRAIKGVTMCRIQDESKYGRCWDTGVVR